MTPAEGQRVGWRPRRGRPTGNLPSPEHWGDAGSSEEGRNKKKPSTTTRPNDVSSLTELWQRVLDFKIVLVKSQKPLGDVESVVSGSTGNGIRPSVQTDLKDTGEEKWNQVDLKGSEYRDGGDGLVDLQLCRNKLEQIYTEEEIQFGRFLQSNHTEEGWAYIKQYRENNTIRSSWSSDLQRDKFNLRAFKCAETQTGSGRCQTGRVHKENKWITFGSQS